MASRRKNASVYENTTTIVVNLIRASSQIALGRSRGGAPMPPALTPAPAPPARPVAEMSLVVEPVTRGAAETAVDELAARFIERIRKNLRAQHYSGPAADFTPPPPVPKSAARFTA